ncbi:MAG: mercury resistance system transport protein MerF [Tateyamaria sp.]|uniref:mercury resistance system transport protein MerF n=1 Tax=Tateyamaria sp. TaxID=1929288 RepID=UPI00329CD192
MKSSRRLFRIGAIGTVITALCCFTPFLVVALTSLGLAGAISYLDIVLLPVLGAFMVLLIVALIQKMRPDG